MSSKAIPVIDSEMLTKINSQILQPYGCEIVCNTDPRVSKEHREPQGRISVVSSRRAAA